MTLLSKNMKLKSFLLRRVDDSFTMNGHKHRPLISEIAENGHMEEFTELMISYMDGNVMTMFDVEKPMTISDLIVICLKTASIDDKIHLADEIMNRLTESYAEDMQALLDEVADEIRLNWEADAAIENKYSGNDNGDRL